MTTHTVYGSRPPTEASAATARKNVTAVLIDTERKWSGMSEDLIRRSDAIKVLYQCTPFNPNGIALLEKCEKEIRAIPSADRPQGEWIEQEECWQCSECGDEYVLEVGVKPIDARMHYCPNCGARMKGKDNE